MNIENIQHNIIKNNLTDMFNDYVAKKVSILVALLRLVSDIE